MTEAEFENIFKTQFNKLTHAAYTVVKDRDLARDVTQQAFIKFWKIKDKVNVDDNLASYLKKAVINTAINELEKSRKLILDDTVLSATLKQSEEEKESISPQRLQKITQAAIAELPDKCGMVFSLSRYEGMTNQEIADYLEISIKAVEKHITKAIKELRIKLQPYRHLLPLFLIGMVGF